MTGKEARIYRIGEVSRITATKAFVLRFWETEFPMLRPVKSAKGQRLYREQDVAMVLEIRRLLYDEGFTIAGARKHLKENGAGDTAVPQSAERETSGDSGGVKLPLRAKARKALADARDELRAILKLLAER